MESGRLKTMLDIRLLREQPDLVKTRLGLRGSSLDATVDEVLACDTGRRAAETRLQTLQADRNKLSKEIGRLRSQKQDSSAIEAQVKSQAAEMQALGEESAA